MSELLATRPDKTLKPQPTLPRLSLAPSLPIPPSCSLQCRGEDLGGGGRVAVDQYNQLLLQVCPILIRLVSHLWGWVGREQVNPIIETSGKSPVREGCSGARRIALLVGDEVDDGVFGQKEARDVDAAWKVAPGVSPQVERQHLASRWSEREHGQTRPPIPSNPSRLSALFAQRLQSCCHVVSGGRRELLNSDQAHLGSVHTGHPKVGNSLKLDTCSLDYLTHRAVMIDKGGRKGRQGGRDKKEVR